MKKTRIRNGRIFTEEGRFEEGTLYMAGERIVTASEYEHAAGTEDTVEAAGNYIIPGLTDIHFHGCRGYDCCDGTQEAFQKIAEYELSQGVTTITPATMTVSEETLSQIMRAAAAFPNESGAILCGLYMEGPFICEAKKGAQNAAYIRRPDVEMFERLQRESGGMIRSVVIAPETDCAMEFIQSLAGKVNISLGHMDADYDTALRALSLGASQLTHLYNAMPPYVHRAPGPIAAAADSPGCMAELICDGIHIHPAAVRMTFRIFGDDRIIFISDSLSATGMEDGQYWLGGQKVYVTGSRATLSDGTLAGSVTSLMGCMRTAVRAMGIPLESAVKCAAVNPVKAIGLYDEYGSLTPGKTANVVILNEELEVCQVYKKGERQTFGT